MPKATNPAADNQAAEADALQTQDETITNLTQTEDNLNDTQDPAGVAYDADDAVTELADPVTGLDETADANAETAEPGALTAPAAADTWDDEGPEANRVIHADQTNPEDDENAVVAPIVAAPALKAAKAKKAPTTVAEAQEAVGKPVVATSKARIKEAAKTGKAAVVKGENLTAGEVAEGRDAAFGKGKTVVAKTGKGKFGEAAGEPVRNYALSVEGTGFASRPLSELGESHTGIVHHGEWGPGTVPVAYVREELGRADELKFDGNGMVSGLRFKLDEAGYIIMASGHKITRWGLFSVAQFFGLKASTIKDLTDPVWGGKMNKSVVDMFNQRIKEYPSADTKEVRLRYRTVPSEDADYLALRAIRPMSYLILDNEMTFNTTMNAVPAEGRDDVIATHYFHDADNMVMTLLLPNLVKARPDSEYGVGISISNSEVGAGNVTIEPFLARKTCFNGCIWGHKSGTADEGVVIQKHTGVFVHDDFQKAVNKAVTIALQEGAGLLTQFDHAKEVAVPNPEATVMLLSEQFGLTSAQGRQWYAGYRKSVETEGTTAPMENTLFGLVNGLTMGSKEFDGYARQYMERTAGNILAANLKDGIADMQKRVKDFNKQANSLSQTNVDRYIFGKGLEGDAPEQNTLQQVQVIAAG